MKNELNASACSRFMKALADPERLKIVECLRGGPQAVSDIATALRSELANVSHHLSVLKETKLVCTKRSGKNIIYSLNPEVFTRESASLNFGCCKVVLRGE